MLDPFLGSGSTLIAWFVIRENGISNEKKAKALWDYVISELTIIFINFNPNHFSIS